MNWSLSQWNKVTLISMKKWFLNTKNSNLKQSFSTSIRCAYVYDISRYHWTQKKRIKDSISFFNGRRKTENFFAVSISYQFTTLLAQKTRDTISNLGMTFNFYPQRDIVVTFSTNSMLLSKTHLSYFTRFSTII